MRSTATLLLSLAMALGALGLAFAAPGPDHQKQARFRIQGATGAVHIQNSRAGQAVFNAAGMRPGEGVSGTVRIGNDGDAPGSFSVRRGGVQDVLGPNGGALSQRVELVLFDITNVHAPVTVYAGPPANFDPVTLGTFAPGKYRDYLFAATLPDGGSPGSGLLGDNRYQGSSMSLGFEWRATTTAAATPTPTPKPKPPTTKPKPPAKPPVITGDALADALGLPPAKKCASRRKFTIKLKAPAGATVVSATITINGKVKARVSGGKTRAPVDLRGLPKGKFKVTIATRASDGKTYTSTRTYRTCGLKKKKSKTKRR
jgi:hypothetical protein